MTKSESQIITRDPIYYATVAFFTVLTTLLPAVLGQPRFLPILQTVSLTVFVAIPLHYRHFSGALKVMTVWLPTQFIVILLLTRLFATHMEGAFTDGFFYRAAISGWYFGSQPYPNGLTSNPINYIVEIVGVLLGSLVTAGLVGIWFIVRLINQAAFGAGSLLGFITNPMEALLVIPYWTLLRIAGYAGLIVLCANPLLTYNWSPSYHWQNHRKLILVSVALIVVGIIMELFLPGLFARPPLP